MIEKVKNNKFMVFFSIVFGGLLFFIMRWNLADIDSFQLFTNAHMMKQGSVLYKDVNVLTPPLVHYINFLGVLIYDQLAVMPIINALYAIAITYVGYCVTRELGMGPKYSLVTSACISLAHTHFEIWCYNSLCNLFNEIILLFLLKASKKDKVSYKDIAIIGALCGASIMSKQSTGLIATAAAALCIGIIIYKKDSLKSCFWAAIPFGIALVSSVGIVLIPVFATGAFPDFVDQVFMGVSTFKLDYILGAFVRVGSVAVFFTLMLIMGRKSLQGVVTYIMALASLAGMIPTANIAHMSCSWGFIMFVLAYYIKNLEDGQKIASAIIMAASTIAAAAAVVITCCYIKNDTFIQSDLKYTKGMYQNRNFDYIISETNKYIEAHPDNEYRIISTFASYFNVNREDVYYKYYDMILNGNTGTVNPLEMVKQDKDKYYFIANWDHTEDDVDWQIDSGIFDFLYGDEFIVEEFIGDTGLAVYRLQE